MSGSSSTAGMIIDSIDELNTFIEELLHKQQKTKKKQIQHKDRSKTSIHRRSQIDKNITNLHLSVVNSNKYFQQNAEKVAVSNTCTYSKLIDPNKKTNLYLEWNNDFCLTEETEDYTLDWIMKQFPYKKYGFGDKKDDIKLFLKQQQLYNHRKYAINIKSDISGKSIFEYDCDLIAKTLTKFYDFRLRHWCLMLNKTLNMFFRNENEAKWWKKQLQNLRNINANEWFQKCVEWKIMPSRLLKDLIATKKLFISDYTMSLNVDIFQKQFLKYYDDRSDFKDEDYFKPLHEYEKEYDPYYQKSQLTQELKAQRNRGYHMINTFLSDIGRIPHKYGGYDKFMKNGDEIVKIKQYKMYERWIKCAENVHRRKWVKYLKKKIQSDTDNICNGIWDTCIEPLKEYQRCNGNMDDYSIPNMDNLLCISVCEEMCKILLMDGMLGINNQFKSRAYPSGFEEFVFDAIKSIFGERDDGIMMNEKDVRESECNDVTPDVLFSSSVNINGVDIYWMDVKHYYVTSKEPITFRTIGHQMTNYCRSFGNGAIVCCGFQANFVEKLRKINPEMTATILMLDASAWYPFAKRQLTSDN